MKLEIDKDRVISAAEKCPQAKETLKTLFPEVFEDDEKYFNFKDLPTHFLPESGLPDGFDSNCIQVRTDANLARKGFYLRNIFNWEIIKDTHDDFVLVPTKK